MFGFFRHNQQVTERPEPGFDSLLAEATQFIEGSEPSFEGLLAAASQLRRAVLAKMDDLSSKEKATVLCYVHYISMQMHRNDNVSPETLPFGSLHAVPPEQAALLVAEVIRFIDDAGQNGDTLGVLAGAYCQSMAMACLAGSMEKGLEQELEFINLKNELGQHTGMLMDAF